MEKGSEKLKLFKADLFDYDGLYAAIDGCSGVFHIASPNLYHQPSNPQVTIYLDFMLYMKENYYLKISTLFYVLKFNYKLKKNIKDLNFRRMYIFIYIF